MRPEQRVHARTSSRNTRQISDAHGNLAGRFGASAPGGAVGRPRRRGRSRPTPTARFWISPRTREPRRRGSGPGAPVAEARLRPSARSTREVCIERPWCHPAMGRLSRSSRRPSVELRQTIGCDGRPGQVSPDALETVAIVGRDPSGGLEVVALDLRAQPAHHESIDVGGHAANAKDATAAAWAGRDHTRAEASATATSSGAASANALCAAVGSHPASLRSTRRNAAGGPFAAGSPSPKSSAPKSAVPPRQRGSPSSF